MSVFFGLDVVSLILGFLVFLFFWKIAQCNGKTGIINKIPGPMPYPFVGNIFDMLEPREKVLERVEERRMKYGVIFRLWVGARPLVVLTRPEHIEIVLRSSKHSEKGFGYDFLHPWLGTGLLTSHGEKWAMHRKLISPSFHFKVLQGFVNSFHENANILVNKLKPKAETGEEFDIYSFVTLCALDIICETAMGLKVKAQLEDNNQYVRSVYRLSSLVVHRMNRVWLHPDFLFGMSSSGKEFQEHLDIVQSFTNKVIQTRKQTFTAKKSSEGSNDHEERKKLSFLDLLLESSMDNGSFLLTDAELREEVETFMFEGHDTTASSMSWTLSVLGRRPELQEACYKELKEIFEKDPDRVPTIADLAEMKLLERVIKETLRLRPSVTAISRILEEDIKVGDYCIPKGTDALISIYLLHRNPELYPNPTEFDPDRFLPENCSNRHPFAYLPFSAGPRNCIGQKFALNEEKIVLSTLLRNYRFHSLEPTEKVKAIPDLILRPASGIRMKISKR